MPKVDFLLIVLNGEPFIEAWLKTYEPHANKVFVVEGTDHERFRGMPKWLRQECHTADGHSVDNTREIVRSFPSKKVELIDTSPKTGTGFWPSKNWMIRAITDKVEGKWLWEADYDEFLHQADIKKVMNLIQSRRDQAIWQFKVWNFWRSATHVLQGAWVSPFRRIFRWSPGKTKFTEHRPPTTNMGGIPKTLPCALYHYNYILEKDAKYKPFYHAGIYGKDWYESRWKAWTPKTKVKLEIKGIGPDRWRKTGTVHRPNLEHPEHVKPVIKRLIKKGRILP